jgi:hypothetical protein
LSATQAAAVADAATADPAAETRLLEKAARASVRGLREECARTKAAADPDADARYERLHRKRCLRSYTDQEGAWNLHARGPAHLGAQVMAALDSLTDELFQRAHAERPQEPREAYAFDALVALAQSGSGRTGTKYRALVRVDLEALTRGATEGEERCEVTGIGPIPVRIARQVLGDAIVDLLVTRGRDVATVVYLGRGPTATQKLALLWSQPTCSRHRAISIEAKNNETIGFMGAPRPGRTTASLWRTRSRSQGRSGPLSGTFGPRRSPISASG